MTTSRLSNIENQIPNITGESVVNLTPSPIQKKLFTLKVVENLLLAALFTAGVLTFIIPRNDDFFVTEIISFSFLFFLLLINRQAFQESKNETNQYDFNKKAELSNYLLSDRNSLVKNTFTPVKAKALQYCQELIDDYKRTRNSARSLYYILQITTVIFSGVTPILVLVDKLESGQAWLKWLPVICPAIASILASIVTSFPFQKNWIAANAAVELLEAEQEKFILGVTPPYRWYDVSEETQQQQKASQALEYFIVQVNNIHLNQVRQASETQSDKQEASASNEAKSSQG